MRKQGCYECGCGELEHLGEDGACLECGECREFAEPYRPTRAGLARAKAAQGAAYATGAAGVGGLGYCFVAGTSALPVVAIIGGVMVAFTGLDRVVAAGVRRPRGRVSRRSR